MAQSRLSRIEQVRRDNLEAAEAILKDPEHWGGEGSLGVTWAREILRLGVPDQGSLFEAGRPSVDTNRFRDGRI